MTLADLTPQDVAQLIGGCIGVAGTEGGDFDLTTDDDATPQGVLTFTVWHRRAGDSDRHFTLTVTEETS